MAREFTDSTPLLDDLGEQLDRIFAGEEAVVTEPEEEETPEGLEEYAGTLPPDRVEQDLWIDRRLVALAMIDAEIEHNNAVAQARIDEAKAWAEAENATLLRQREFLENQLLIAAQTYPYGGRKSRRLPSGGEIGKRTTPERVAVIDKEAALAFAKAHPALSADVKVEVKESISTTTLTNYYRSTGEVPPGCEAVPAKEKPFVRPPKP